MLGLPVIIFIPLFIIATFLAFFVPGRVVLGKIDKFSPIGIVAVSYILGIVLWGWQGYLFGFLHLRNLSYLYLVIFLLLFLKNKYLKFKFPHINIKKLDFITLILLSIGIFCETFQFIRMGQITSNGVFVSVENILDQSWHSTLVTELAKRFPPFEPGMYGIPLLNYHFWFNLVTADISRVFYLPTLQTQFIGMHALGPILLALITIALATAIQKSKIFLRIMIFFVMFAANAGSWFALIFQHKFNLGLDWLFDDGSGVMDAPGRGFALLIVLAAIYFLYIFKNKFSIKNILIIGLLFGSLMGFKVYMSIPFMMGLFVLSLFGLIKKDFSTFVIFIISSILFLIQFIPFSLSSGGLFLLPFDIPREFFAQGRLHMSFMDQRWRIYMDHKNYLRLLEYGVLMSVGFLFAQFGIKLLALIPIKKAIKEIGIEFYLFLYSSLIASFILGLLFFQKVGGANVWEFFMASSIILSILVSINIFYLLPKNKIIVIFVLILVIIFTIPKWIDNVTGYAKGDYLTPFHGLSNLEMEGIDYIRNNTPQNSDILVLSVGPHAYYSSMLSVLMDRSLFFSGIGVSQIETTQIAERRKATEILKKTKDTKIAIEILKKYNLKYLFIYKPLQLKFVDNKNFKVIFENNLEEVIKLNEK